MNAPTTASALQTIALPTLADGEIYAGILIVDGKPAHHLALLPCTTKPLSWKKAVSWAQEQGGALPTRKEQALLFANAAQAFERDWYWSGEQYAGDESFAWCQDFISGYQDYNHKDFKLRARAVRRVII